MRLKSKICFGAAERMAPVVSAGAGLWKLVLLLVLACATAASATSAKGTPTAVRDADLAVKISTRREGAETHFYVENRERCEITMTFEMGLVNLKGSAPFPYTATFPPQQVTEAFRVSPVDRDSKWEYSYTNYYKLGSNCVRHDDSYVYQLPYAPGSKYKVTQGYNGAFSHKGSNLYATDWQMPEGTPVLAARGGVVVKIKDNSDTGGANIKFDPFNNYVLIRHEDGTLGHYCHLQKNGCCVAVGQTVQPGQQIARSGNTGFSSGAHLHFSVFKTKDGRSRISLPVRFKTSDEQAVTLLEGHRYKAPEIQTASTAAVPPGHQL